MPSYYPDLNSVKRFAEQMQLQRSDVKKYKGIVPTTEAELPEARKQLGEYMRDVWQDEVAALEIELAVEPHNYHEKMRLHIANRLLRW